MANNPYRDYKLAGEGTSSCTYVPPVIHLGNTIVQLKKKTTAQQNINRVTSLDLPEINKNRPFKNRRLLYPSTNIKEVPEKFPKGKCKLKDDPKNPLRTVEIPYGGKDLSNLAVTQEDIFAFFTAFENIFNGLLELHKKNIAHLDVKSTNMVGEKEGDTYSLKVIDFGISKKTDIKSHNSEFYNYEYKDKKIVSAEPINYPFWSYDLRLLNKDIFKKLYGENIPMDIIDFKNNFTYYKYPKILIKGIDSDLVEKLLVKIDDTNKSEVLLKSDVFSLGLSLYSIWRRLTGYALDDEGDLTHLDALNGMSRSETDDAYIPANSQILICKNTNKACIKKTTEIEASKKVFELVIKMCISDPFERLSLEDALTEYTSVVLPSIKTAYPHLPQNEGGSRKLRTRRTNKKYVKSKKTRRKLKRKLACASTQS